MNLPNLNKRFNTRHKCIRHLEKVKWNGKPVCPHCQATNITPRIVRKYFYHCNNCNKDFTVLFDTIFEGSKLKLPKWFMLITIMLNARKGVAAKELERQLGVTYKTAWYSAMRVRCAMIEEDVILEGIVEMDEVYIGGRPRHRNSGANEANLSRLSTKRGRGTKKVSVVGMVERDGEKRVVTQIENKLTTKTMLTLLKKYVKEDRTIMMTDEANFYKKFDDIMQHLVVNHGKKEYVKGIIHTNTIEGFWSIIKNGIRGEYHVLSRKYLPFYLAEWSYKYNRRSKEKEKLAFDETIDRALEDKKLMVNYKPTEEIPESFKVSEENGKGARTKFTSKFLDKIKDKVKDEERKKLTAKYAPKKISKVKQAKINNVLKIAAKYAPSKRMVKNEREDKIKKALLIAAKYKSA